MLHLDGTTFAYATQPVVRDLSCVIPAGAVVGILGPNGAGKSTLCKLVTGLLRPTAGELRLEGEPIAAIPRQRLARMVAFVPQETHVTFPMRARDIVRLGRLPHRRGWGSKTETDERIVNRALEWMASLPFADRTVQELSGGERQRIFIARALAQEPRLLVCDEPTTHLDLHYQTECLHGLVRWTRERGVTLIASLHDVNLAAHYCSHLLLLRDGRMHGFGPPREVLSTERLAAVYETALIAVSHPERGTPVYVPHTT